MEACEGTQLYWPNDRPVFDNDAGLMGDRTYKRELVNFYCVTPYVKSYMGSAYERFDRKWVLFIGTVPEAKDHEYGSKEEAVLAFRALVELNDSLVLHSDIPID